MDAYDVVVIVIQCIAYGLPIHIHDACCDCYTMYIDLCEDIEMKQSILSLIDQAHDRRTRRTRQHGPSQRRHSSSRR